MGMHYLQRIRTHRLHRCHFECWRLHRYFGSWSGKQMCRAYKPIKRRRNNMTIYTTTSCLQEEAFDNGCILSKLSAFLDPLHSYLVTCSSEDINVQMIGGPNHRILTPFKNIRTIDWSQDWQKECKAHTVKVFKDEIQMYLCRQADETLLYAGSQEYAATAYKCMY